MKNEHGRLIWDSLIDIIKSSIDKLSSINTIARLLILLVLFFWKGRINLLLRQVLVLKKLAVYPNSFGVIPVNVIFNSED
ncbi:hypothetical protein, partial [Lentilactobacillus hilgardii]|uniref:hypothetical protein n=1 Tax=Lentilactobacillus hilgardii TaxID=1588 RepID=UPI0021A3E7A3